MLVIRGTKKLRDRVKSAHTAEGEQSTSALGDWFASANNACQTWLPTEASPELVALSTALVY